MTFSLRFFGSCSSHFLIPGSSSRLLPLRGVAFIGRVVIKTTRTIVAYFHPEVVNVFLRGRIFGQAEA